MDKIIKVITAVLHIAAFCFCTVFIPLASLGHIEISLLDVVKMGFGKFADFTFLGNGGNLIEPYVKPYVYAVLFLLVVVIVTAVLNMFLKNEIAYIAGILGQAVMNVTAIVLYLDIKEKINGIKEVARFFGIGNSLKFNSAPVLIWSCMEGLALFLNIVGLVIVKRNQKMETMEDILPETLYNYKNPWQQEESHEKQEKKIRPLKEERNEMKDFFGAIIGVTGVYSSLAYELRKLELVYISQDDQQIKVCKNRQGTEAIAEIYFIPQYKEYCVKPIQKLKVFLESGQPLGERREYYLPRKTKIYFGDKKCAFELA